MSEDHMRAEQLYRTVRVEEARRLRRLGPAGRIAERIAYEVAVNRWMAERDDPEMRRANAIAAYFPPWP